MSRPLLAWLPLGIMSCVLGASCLLGDFAVEPVGEGGAGGSAITTGGGGVAGGGGLGGCVLKKWPDPPVDAPGGGSEEIVVALRTIDVGEDFGDAGPTVGYDLDDACTTTAEETTCVLPPSVDKPDEVLDGPGGIDNNGAKIFAIASAVFPGVVSSEAFTTGLDTGDWNILIRVRGYNGEANDDQVELALFPSPGFRFDPCNDPAAGGSSAESPTWQGDDQWPVHGFAVQGGSATGGSGAGGGMEVCVDGPDPALEDPAYVDANAYVTDHVVVASLPKTELALSGGSTPARVNILGGYVTARIVDHGNGRALVEGRLGGTWPASDILADMASFFVFDGMTMCTNHDFYEAVRAAACGRLDIESTVGGPTSPCDAVSFAVEFEAEPARLGSLYQDAGQIDGCEPQYDPANDSCDRPR